MLRLRQLSWKIIRILSLGGILLQVHPKSYLMKNGWFHSFSQKKSIDLLGNAIPWWSYGVTAFIAERLQKDMTVLEFGSGNSSIWIAGKVKRLVTLENDASWARYIKSSMPSNVILIELDDPEKLHGVVGAELFDVLVIDPLADRINCAKAGIPYLKEDGVVIWDNTDGSDWPEIKSLMIEFGFKEISFSGLAPQEVSEDRTTIFYKKKNSFLI